ncbi:MAG: gamma carbonic anhydrase family protein [Candidatus Methylacidiphilales bacterium]
MTIDERLEFFLGRDPDLKHAAFVAPSADICGSVQLGPLSSVWYQCVLRGDINTIDIGEGTNIQDGTVVHLADDFGVKIGKYTTVGHQATIHACEIGDECLIGMGAVILDGAVIGNQCIIGAGALVTKGMHIPDGSLVLGSPAKVVRELDASARASLKNWAEKYVHAAAAHHKRFAKS